MLGRPAGAPVVAARALAVVVKLQEAAGSSRIDAAAVAAGAVAGHAADLVA